MEWIESAAVVAMFFASVVFILVVAHLVLPLDKSQAERAQEERERREQAALDALRDLGRKYPRPKNY